MKLVFLLLFAGAVAYVQVPVVSNYSDFITGVEEGHPTALRLEGDDIEYGAMIHSWIYQEVMPLDAEHFLFMNEVFESPAKDRKQAKGVAYVCLCQKGDLVSILERWKDGQKSLNDYARFDCKFKNIPSRAEFFKGDSFWKGLQPLKKITELQTHTESVQLAQNIDILVFKNVHNPTKKVLKIAYDMPLDKVVKVVEDESFLTSVKSDDNQELLVNQQPAKGWKALFPDWKDYKQLNSGFWGEPGQTKHLEKGRYSNSFVIAPDPTQAYKVKGQTMCLVQTPQTQSKTIQNLPLNQGRRIIKGDVYLDYGERIKYGVNGLVDAEQKVTVTFSADIPISAITAFDVHSGKELATANQAPFELLIPYSASEINLKVEYPALKRVRVDFETVGH